MDGRWDAAYVPLQIQRQPFSLIACRAEDSEGKPPSLDVALDLSQTVQSQEGERLFLEDGQPTKKFLQNITSMRVGAACGSQGRLRVHRPAGGAQLDRACTDRYRVRQRQRNQIARVFTGIAAALRSRHCLRRNWRNYAIASFSNGCTFQMASTAHVS